jgi:AcrR family transcriptional regulator
MSQPPDAAESSVERILQAAAQLFARHGYHGVTTRQMAAAAGLNIGTVHHHLGTKREVYLAVYERLRQEDAGFVGELERRFEHFQPVDSESLAQGLCGMADDFVDYVARDAVRARLFLRHWLETDPELRQFEAERSLDLYRKLRRILQRARGKGWVSWSVNPGIILRNIDWMVYSYFVCGAFNWRTWRGDPREERSLRAFKASLRAYLRSMLHLPPEEAS